MPEMYRPSESEVPNYPHYYRRALDKLRRMQRTLSKMIRGSQHYHKQRKRIALLHERIANQRKDFLNKSSRQIANAYDCAEVEDMNMRVLAQALHFGKSVYDNGWSMFTAFLAYKLAEQGKQLVKGISGFHPARFARSAAG